MALNPQKPHSAGGNTPLGRTVFAARAKCAAARRQGREHPALDLSASPPGRLARNSVAWPPTLAWPGARQLRRRPAPTASAGRPAIRCRLGAPYGKSSTGAVCGTDRRHRHNLARGGREKRQGLLAAGAPVAPPLAVHARHLGRRCSCVAPPCGRWPTPPPPPHRAGDKQIVLLLGPPLGRCTQALAFRGRGCPPQRLQQVQRLLLRQPAHISVASAGRHRQHLERHLGDHAQGAPAAASRRETS
jgi:hypothetical protein